MSFLTSRNGCLSGMGHSRSALRYEPNRGDDVELRVEGKSRLIDTAACTSGCGGRASRSGDGRRARRLYREEPAFA